MGYRHFALFTLPDLSLTPRYQNDLVHLREITHQSVTRLNQILIERIPAIRAKHPECSILIYDAYALFGKAWNDPAAFGLDEDKKHQPYTTSKDFKISDDSSIDKGYMFWDEVHPTETMHRCLAQGFYTVFGKFYSFEMPMDPPLEQFRQAYGKRLAMDRARFLGDFRRSNIAYKDPELTHEKIIHHAFHEKGFRTMDVIVGLDWVTRDRKLTGFARSAHPGLDLVIKAVEKSRQKRLFPEKKDEHTIASELDVGSGQAGFELLPAQDDSLAIKI